jgi:tRNA-specific 2-thiouridylase
MRVLLAMSGGVDSAAAAALVLRAGHTAEGCTLRLTGTAEEAREIDRAAESAKTLGIPHTVLDLCGEFYREVILPFAEAYRAGRTPNPCVLCNREIKLGALYRYARERGFDRIATGHYARTVSEGGRTLLCRGLDAAKDQSYMLSLLSGEVLSHLLLPLGELTKAEARAIAEECGLAAARAGESQDICFIPDGDRVGFLERLWGGPAPTGHFVDADGNILGTHRGLSHYTVGQHKGLGIALGRVRYVTRLCGERLEVTLGDEADLYKREVYLPALHLIAGERPTAPYRATAKLRYRQTDAPVTVYPEGEGARLVFDEPQRAPAPGQTAVLYCGDRVLGGGEIG